MKWLSWPVAVASLAVLVGAVSALGADQPATTTYRWVDAQGVVHYSDTPQPGAEKLKIQPAQTYSAPATTGATTPRALEQESGNAYQACGVAQPTADQTFFAPESITVSVDLRPSLRSDDQLSVTMDGAPLQALDESGLHYRISDPERGTHTISVSVHDASGKVVCSSSGAFDVQRPSRLSPQSPTRH